MRRTMLAIEIWNFNILEFWLIRMDYGGLGHTRREWECGLILFNWTVFEIN